MNNRYVEFATGGVGRRNQIHQMGSFVPDSEKGVYRSIFLFDERLGEHVKKTGSVSGYSGPHEADALVWDFDGGDLDPVRLEVLAFHSYLVNELGVPPELISVAFSGQKGFHVSVPMAACGQVTPTIDFHAIYRRVALQIAEGFRFVDTSIYEVRRLLRVLNTRHEVSLLYKIPLSVAELGLTGDEIRRLAERPRQEAASRVVPITVVARLESIWATHAAKRVVEPRINTRSDPGGHSGFLTLLSGVSELNRNTSATKLAGLFRRAGIGEHLALEFVRMWNERNQPPLEDEEIGRVVSGVYRRYTPGVVPIDDTPKIYSQYDAMELYREYAAMWNKTRVLTGFPLVDQKMRGILPGETCCILGTTGVGKTALLLNIGLHHAKATGEPVLFFSMEMPVVSVFERTMQYHLGISGDEVQRRFTKDPAGSAMVARSAIEKAPSVYVVERSGLTLYEIDEHIRFAEEPVYGRKTGLVMIDYLGLVKGDGEDLYRQVSAVARGMKDLAKNCGVPVIFLSQVNRSVSKSGELTIGVARDSGAIDEASDFILGIWEDGSVSGPPDLKMLKLGIIKNRRGAVGECSVVMEKKTTRIRPSGD